MSSSTHRTLRASRKPNPLRDAPHRQQQARHVGDDIPEGIVVRSVTGYGIRLRGRMRQSVQRRVPALDSQTRPKGRGWARGARTGGIVRHFSPDWALSPSGTGPSRQS
jgi:hypothetical protein